LLMLRVSFTVLLICEVTVSPLRAQLALRITSPADGMVVNPGQKITVTVEASSGMKGLFFIGEDPFGFSTPLTAPPWVLTLTIPTNVLAMRPRSLTAIGGWGSEPVYSRPVHLDIERPDAPLGITSDFSTLDLQPGDEIPLEIKGVFRDGANLWLTESTRTFYKSAGPSVATVNGGEVKAVSVGSTRITVTHMNREAVVLATVTARRAMFPSRTELRASKVR
jgi:hypothetical protein